MLSLVAWEHEANSNGVRPYPLAGGSFQWGQTLPVSWWFVTS